MCKLFWNQHILKPSKDLSRKWH